MALLVLSASDVKSVTSALTTNELVNLMASVFATLSAGKGITSPHRTSIQMSNHNTLFMPSRIEGIGTAIKVVAVPTSAVAASRGLPASTIAMDENTGAVKALVNASSLTALRTAAGSLLATQLLGPKEPRTLVSFGAGGQIEAHIDLHLHAYPSIKTVAIVNRTDNERLSQLVSALRTRHDPSVTISGICSSSENQSRIREYLSEADIICTATSSRFPLFEASCVPAGAHVNLVGSYTPQMMEVDTDLIIRARKIAVDSRNACLIEAGDLIHAGVSQANMVELGELASIADNGGLSVHHERCAELKSAGDITIFKSVGVGVQDVAITNMVVNRAEQLGMGTRIESYNKL